MQRSVININEYRYLIEYYDANTDMKNNQYMSEFVILRNYNIVNNLIHDNDIYFIEKQYLNEYIDELRNNDGLYGDSIVFPVTSSVINSYSNSYVKFNDNINLKSKENIYKITYDSNDNEILEYGSDIYELYGIENKKLIKNKKIKCDKIRIYHPMIKKNLNAIIDISNYINNIHFHYICRPINKYLTNSETEIHFNNTIYSEFVEIYFPNMNDLFGLDKGGNYNVYYNEDFNIVASTLNENFINSILSNSEDLEHFENEIDEHIQYVPLNLMLQPYRIVEEYAAESQFNYDNNLSNDEKIFVKLFLKNNTSISNNYLTNTLNIIIYPYSDVDKQTNLYILDQNLSQGYSSINNETKFKLMGRLGFSNGIISVVTMFDYPGRSYFYSRYKDDSTTSPIKEAYKYYNNVDDKYYNLFINEEVLKELEDIDAVDSISDDIIQTVKEVANVNYDDKDELLKVWKKIMKESIIEEYEEEFGSPTQFLGFKIDIYTDMNYKHNIYSKNVRINFDDIDDFSFKLNGIFSKWEEKPEKLIVRTAFYDRVLGIELRSNIVIITKEWFKYLINNSPVYRLSNLSNINKDIKNDMTVIDLENNNVNFINSIKCIVRKDEYNKVNSPRRLDQKIIFKPIFYKVKDLQNISLRAGTTQNIGINLSEYMTKVETFKLLINNVEYIESGRNDIYVIFKINSNNLEETSGTYDITNEEDQYISSGKWTINS
jgi:hypothetical protein